MRRGFRDGTPCAPLRALCGDAPAASAIPPRPPCFFQGPADRWFGVGFGADAMCVHMVSDECPEGGPYAIVVSGESVTERKLAFHGAGDVLPRSVTVQSSTVQNGYRTVVLTRPLSGASPKHYTFDPTKPSMPIINAKCVAFLLRGMHICHQLLIKTLSCRFEKLYHLPHDLSRFLSNSVQHLQNWEKPIALQCIDINRACLGE